MVGLVLVLPPRPGGILVLAVGAVLGVITVVKLLDMGFLAALNRPFDPLSDWSYIGPGISVLADSIGRLGAVSAVVVAGFVIVGVAVAVPMAVRRLTRLAARDRVAASRFVAAFAVVWLVGAVVGLQIAPGAPIASADAAQRAYAEVGQIRAGIRDQAEFEAAIADDPTAATPASELLAGLRGKDVIFAFVESYGRVALQDPAVVARRAHRARCRHETPDGRRVLVTQRVSHLADVRRHQLARARDACSPGSGSIPSGGTTSSWRAIASRSAARSSARAGAPSPTRRRTTRTGPSRRRSTGYDQVYDSGNVGYRGPKFGFATIPDQYTLAAFQRAELAPADRRPVMAEIDLLTSHTPWAPLPSFVDWAHLGDGSVYAGMPEQAASVEEVWADGEPGPGRVRPVDRVHADRLISFVETYGNDDLVLVVVGDHQPAPIVSGPDAGHDVPIADRRPGSGGLRADRRMGLAGRPAPADRTRRSGRWTRSATGCSAHSGRHRADRHSLATSLAPSLESDLSRVVLAPNLVAQHQERQPEDPERVIGAQFVVVDVHVELLAEAVHGQRGQLAGCRGRRR